MNIVVDCAIVATTTTLIFYLALQSVSGAVFAGIGSRYGNQSLEEPVLLLVIFALGIWRLVVDLRGN